MMPQIDVDVKAQAIASMDVGELSAIASQAAGEPVTVTDWHVALLGGLDSSPLAGGVYKVAGTAVPTSAPHIRREWTAVVKILRSPEGFTMPGGNMITHAMAEDLNNFGYWQREVLVAQSDLFAALPAGLRAPRSLGVTHSIERECWLWQEYLPADQVWGWDEYREAAFRLGQWQGTAVSQTIDYPWLSHNWLAGWVHGPLTGIFGQVDGMNGYDHPLLAAHFGPEEMVALRQMWADRQKYLDRLARLPQTVCHLDAHRGNLSWQRDDLALVDWAFVGVGTFGEELAVFVGATLLLDFVPLADAEQLEQVAFAGYIAGLRAAGWSGDAAVVWEAYRCAMPLRYAPLSLASMLRTAMQPEFAADWERKTGKPLADILAHRAGLVRFYLSRSPHGEEFVRR